MSPSAVVDIFVNVVSNLVVVVASPVITLCVTELDSSDVNGWFDVDSSALLLSVDDITASLVATKTSVVSAASEVTALSTVVVYTVLCASTNSGSFNGRRYDGSCVSAVIRLPVTV